MAKILVADDNSNVQKTVALALSGLGVDVVSVNNGEAAVRKLSDFSPDLILADIFMPVRNGYEVCEFVKNDSRFSHVPVVLLVGAFDPFDEREAQRVRADGILKKPFVPPDPLINLVKSLLDRVAQGRPQQNTTDSPVFPPRRKASEGGTSKVQVPVMEAAEDPSQEIPPVREAVAFEVGQHPVPFGTLLETAPREQSSASAPAVEPLQDDQVLTKARDSNLGDTYFWKTGPEETVSEKAPETESTDEISAHTRQGAEAGSEEASTLAPMEPVNFGEEAQAEDSEITLEASPALEEAVRGALQIVSPEQTTEEFAVSSETEVPVETVPASQESIFDAGAAASESEEKTKATERASGPFLVPVLELPPLHIDLSAPEKVETQEEPVAAAQDSVVHETVAQESVVQESVVKESIEHQAEAAPVTLEQKPADPARSESKHDWEDMILTIPPFGESEIALLSDAVAPSPTADAPSLQAAVQIPAAETAPAAQAAEEHTNGCTTTAEARAKEMAPEMVDAIVDRVLEKMRPQVVDIITKEFLRPIVQVLVHREIDK